MYYVYFPQTIPLMFEPMLSVKVSYSFDMIQVKRRHKRWLSNGFSCELSWCQLWTYKNGAIIIKIYLWDWIIVPLTCLLAEILPLTPIPLTKTGRFLYLLINWANYISVCNQTAINTLNFHFDLFLNNLSTYFSRSIFFPLCFFSF